MDTSSLGLPPLPRSLRSLLNFNSHQLREMGRVHAMRTSIQQDVDRRRNTSPPARNWNGDSQNNGRRMSQRSCYENQDPVARLESKLALLRREMVALRQTDMSLLCQLWSINESIQDLKQNGEFDDLFDEEAGFETAEAQQAFQEYQTQLAEYNQLLEAHQSSFREAGGISGSNSTSSGAESALGTPEK